ncbi:hydroxyacid dehydrogenase [uncultured Sphingomonas sp.]|uniref:hydroxyacid dehydrogenase n=1 Tax=uncultured Sphingomonas sp. TaxID=158754 RepID=UPI0025F5F6B1|nr:hydroxyacid dehydrogenase [uncultured Sphingomonas sp.]
MHDGRTILFIGSGLSVAATEMAEVESARLITLPPYPDESDLAAVMQREQPGAVIIRQGAITEAAIRAGAPALRLIAKHGVGVDSIDVAAASACGVPVSYTAGANAQSVAEHAFALMFAAARGLSFLDRRMHEGHWDKASISGIELAGRSLGLVGFGTIARLLAGMAGALGMRIGVFDPYAPSDLAVAGASRVADLSTLLADSDVISLHCPLTSETRNLIGTAELAKMRPGAILINTARGGLIDEAALAVTLREGRLAGAGIDTFSTEPPGRDNPLFAAPNLIATPHVGANTQEAKDRVGTTAMRQALDALAGRIPDATTLANPGFHKAA